MATANQKAINSAVDWAVRIAKDNSFHYGESKWAHHSGCYFCGTNGKHSAKVKDGAKYEDQLKTYCCNPFVTAAFNHGAHAPSVDCKVASKRINLANDSNIPLQNKNEWKRIEKPATIAGLKKGDILLTPTHSMIYIGDGKIVHAAGHDDGPGNKAKWDNSIRIENCPLKKWNATTKIYRYIGKGNFKDDPKPSPVSPTTPSYKKGNTYTLKVNLKVRVGSGVNYKNKKVKDVTEDGRKYCTSKIGIMPAIFKKGTKVTCLEVNNKSKSEIWIRVPSGWLCAYRNGSQYIK